MELEAKRPADVDLPVKSQATSASDDQQVNYSDEPSIDNDAKPASASTGETARPRKSISSRLFRSAKLNFFSSLARRIFIFNLIALTALIGAILYLNQFRAGLIDARIESLQTQGNIIAVLLMRSGRGWIRRRSPRTRSMTLMTDTMAAIAGTSFLIRRQR